MYQKLVDCTILKKKKKLTTPMPSMAKITVAKKTGNCLTLEKFLTLLIGLMSMNMKYRVSARPTIMQTFARMENGTRYLRFRICESNTTAGIRATMYNRKCISHPV